MKLIVPHLIGLSPAMISITDFDFSTKLQIKWLLFLLLDEMPTDIETSDISLVQFIFTLFYICPRNHQTFPSLGKLQVKVRG